jgi:hypothetical protein
MNEWLAGRREGFAFYLLCDSARINYGVEVPCFVIRTEQAKTPRESKTSTRKPSGYLFVNKSQMGSLNQSRDCKTKQEKSLKRGDRVILTGVMRVDTLTFPTLESKTIHRIALKQPLQMVAKEKRVSTTV